MLKSIFSYKSIELLGGMTYILSNVRVLMDFGSLVYADEYSTVEVNFEKGIITAYSNGQIQHEMPIALTVPKTTTAPQKPPRRYPYKSRLF